MTGLATILLLCVPFIPGLRDIPRLIPVHRLIWRRWDHPAPGPIPRASQTPESGTGNGEVPTKSGSHSGS
jgi:hypothetical protein